MLVWLTPSSGRLWLSKGRALIRVELILNALHPGSRRILEALIELLWGRVLRFIWWSVVSEW